MHSIVNCWNLIGLLTYLRVIYNNLNFKKHTPKSFMIIKICFAHFSKTVAKTIDKL